jgi:predicted GNAT family N-acyltransferase
MEPRTAISVEIANWDRDEAILRSIREQVFVVEQHVPVELEWDGLDPACVHVIAYVNRGLPVGTARLLEDGHIGRMAVLQPWRRHGIGSCMLRTLIEVARQQGKPGCALNAQTHALGFYARHGFVAEGDVFDDAGMPHRHMELKF